MENMREKGAVERRGSSYLSILLLTRSKALEIREIQRVDRTGDMELYLEGRVQSALKTEQRESRGREQ